MVEEPRPPAFRIIPHYSPLTGILTSFTVEDPEGKTVTKWQQYVDQISRQYPSTSREVREAKVEYTDYRAVFVLPRASFTLAQLTGKPAVAQLTTEERLAHYGVPQEQYEKVIELDKQYNLDELRQMCRDRGLATGGDKKKLISRLLEAGYAE